MRIDKYRHLLTYVEIYCDVWVCIEVYWDVLRCIEINADTKSIKKNYTYSENDNHDDSSSLLDMADYGNSFNGTMLSTRGASPPSCSPHENSDLRYFSTGGGRRARGGGFRLHNALNAYYL